MTQPERRPIFVKANDIDFDCVTPPMKAQMLRGLLAQLDDVFK
jgi:hypothetical protein